MTSARTCAGALFCCGSYPPSVEMLVQLANIFSVSTDCLLGLEDKSYIEVTGLSDEEIAHVQAIVNDIIKRK